MPRTPRSKKLNADEKPVPVKATETEMTLRINSVYKLLILGYDRPYILQHAAERWESSERMADEYMARARAMIDAQTSREQDEHLKIALARLELVFNSAYTMGDYKGALGAQHQLNKILALYAPAKQEINHSGSISWAQLIEQARQAGDHDTD